LVLNLSEFTTKAPGAPSSEKKESETLAPLVAWLFNHKIQIHFDFLM